MSRWLWITWAIAFAAVVLGLAWQVADADGRIDCMLDAGERMIYCAGGLDTWVLPVSAGIGLLLTGIGAWEILSRRR